jgi:hypothetical protein
MINNFLTDDEMQMFLRRLGALAHNTDFESVTFDLRKVLDGIDALLRSVEDVTRLRQLQGNAQILSYLLSIVDQAKTGRI